MNKHSTNLFILAVLITVASLSGCNSLFQNDTPYYKISQPMKDYCYFDKGSFWVYQNDSTGVSDSVIVSDINSYIAFHAVDANTAAFNYDVIETSYDTNTFVHTTGIYAGKPGDNGQSGLYRIFYTSTNFVLAFAPEYNVGEAQLLGGQEGVYTNIDSTVSLSFNGYNFTNVYHTQEKVSIDGSDTTWYDFYFAPHYGLVKWVKSYQGSTESYSLKSSDLIQKK
ncbi:MAG: hypothetical protein JXR65_08170 [Bacteroidales bacterium]|nr:hypothetical protein [Bacteroidales bacterium]